MKKIWIDTDIGTNPDDATAIAFALAHPQIKILGISISGSQQEKRKQEAQSLLEIFNRNDIEIYLGDEITPQIINDQNPDHTIAIGPLTNISKLILEETQLGKLHIMAGLFSEMYYRGRKITTDTNAGKDKEATRIVLTQYEDISISPLDTTAGLYLEEPYQSQIEQKYPYLKQRYEGYSQHLAKKFDQQHSQIILHDILPLFDMLKTTSITKEIIEFYIQPDGSFYCDYPLNSISDQIHKIEENFDSLPVPKVKHEIITNIDSHKIMQELIKTL